MAITFKNLPVTKWVIVPGQYYVVLVAYGWTPEYIEIRATCNDRGVYAILDEYISKNDIAIALIKAINGESSDHYWESRGGRSHWEISPVRKEVPA